MAGQLYIAVVGPGDAPPEVEAEAEVLGAALGEAGAVVVCGGLGGVMAAACRGARTVGATTIGILPGTDRAEANSWVDVAMATGMGEGRNVLVVRAADAVVAVAGGYGTLSEVALALKIGRPVVGLGTWEISGVEAAEGPHDAAARAVALARRR